MKTISLLGKRVVPRYTLILVLITLCVYVSAHHPPSTNQQIQQEPITGTVYDAAGPIPDVSITIKGKNIFAFTDENGTYTIDASPSDTLIFSYPGYETIEVIVANQLVIDVELLESITQLQEAVINAGYYTVKDKERTGSISRVTADEIENQPVGNVLSAVQGRMAGVSITQNSGVPGGGYDIQIRGLNSLRREGNYPLYIIDGIPVSASSPSSLSGTILPYDDINPLNAINPNDIESIEILKDADATAIYGSRGANGVILVTTKKGKQGKTSFSINTNYGISRVASKMELMNTEQYLNMRSEAFANDGITEYPSYAYDVNGSWSSDRYTDWQKELIGGTAINSLVQLSVNGGSENTSFLVSGSHSEQTTIFSNDFRYKTNNLSTNLNHRSKDKKFELALSGLFSYQTNNIINEDLTRQALMLSPNAPQLYNADGTLNWEENTFTNPIASFQSTYSNKTKSFNKNLNMNYELFPSFFIKLNGGLNQTSFEEISLLPNTMYNPSYGMTPANSMAFKGNNQRFSYTAEPQINYRHKFNEHEIDLLIGGTYQQVLTSVLGVEGYGFESNALITNLSAAKTVIISRDEQTEYNYAAIFGRLNYQFQNKYILNLTGRRDGSSRFGPGKRFANFGAIGAAWIFSKENFLLNSNWLSFGKLRGSYGTTGSDLIGDYQYLDTYTINHTLYGGITTMNPSRLYNPNFSWERTNKLEIALELGLFRDRLNLSGAWYQNKSSNQLVGIPLPGTTGFNMIQSNLPATVENKGIELELCTTPVKGNQFRWESNFNISFPKNKLVSFPDLEGSTYANQYVIGYPVSIVKLYNFEGIDPDTGLYTFTDYDGDGNISSPEDNQVIEKIGVKYFGGWSNKLTYKQWDFSFLFQFVNQKQRNYNSSMPTPGTMNNQPLEVLNVWSETNPNGQYMPYSSGADPEKNQLQGYFRNSTASVSDASFIRLKNVQLSYRLPLKNFLQNVLIYVQGQNLLTITDYFGLDPEFALTGFLPPLKTYSFGVQFNF